MSPDERVRVVALALTDRVGWKLIQRLLERFGSLEAILAATPEELRSVQGIGDQIAANIGGIDLTRTAADLARFDQQAITAVTWLDDAYPPALCSLPDRPLVIFWRGTAFPPVSLRSVAIVGTRELSDRSRRLAHEWAAAFARRQWTVVSGLARGVDSAAHQGAVDEGGQSLAVLGCGVSNVYPPENVELARRIAANGALMSEVHPSTTVSPAALRLRNRLITALSSATIVIEAGETSGALHAARYAHQQGRPVFVVPNSAGNLALIDRNEALPLPAGTAEIETVIDQILSRL